MLTITFYESWALKILDYVPNRYCIELRRNKGRLFEQNVQNDLIHEAYFEKDCKVFAVNCYFYDVIINLRRPFCSMVIGTTHSFAHVFHRTSEQSQIWHRNIVDQSLLIFIFLLVFDLIAWLGILAKFRFEYQVNLSELINFCSPWNHQKTIGFQMISREIEINSLKFVYH